MGSIPSQPNPPSPSPCSAWRARGHPAAPGSAQGGTTQPGPTSHRTSTRLPHDPNTLALHTHAPHFPSRGRGRAAWQCTVLPPRGDDALPASCTLQSETEPAPRWQGLLGSLLRTSPPPAGAGGGVGWRGLRRCPVWLHARRCLAIRGAARGRPRGRFGLWQLHEEEQEGTTYGYCIL